MSYCAAHQQDLKDMTMVVAHNQQSGRGQRGNSWESEPGKNLTVTLFHAPGTSDTDPCGEPETLPAQQFRISMATALAVADTLRRYDIDARVKWPNDVYIGNRKACGILIEHTISGKNIINSRIGIGLNVNQTEFLSDAPNPVSMAQAAGHDFILAEVLDAMSECLEHRLKQPRCKVVHDYMALLWRFDNRFYRFRLREGERTEFDARIADVCADGPIVLQTCDGLTRTFYFKEVEFVL